MARIEQALEATERRLAEAGAAPAPETSAISAAEYGSLRQRHDKLKAAVSSSIDTIDALIAEGSGGEPAGGDRR